MQMNRISSITFTIGIATLLAGFLFITLTTPRTNNTAYANLPADHPPIPAGAATIPTTKNDFFTPGTQPNTLTDTIAVPESCTSCHRGYSAQVPQPNDYEPWTGWQGSMMAQAGRDPVFYAALDIANADAANAGEFCLRCHLPRAWANGRIQNGTIDLSADPSELAHDLEGVQCEICHRMVDPQYTAPNPARDLGILAALTSTVHITTGNAAMILDPEDYRRGPFDLTADWSFDPHTAVSAKGTLQSPYHQESALCGTCHDISNPALSWNGTEYALNATDTPFTDTSKMFPIERTFSEWRLSQYNTPGGVYAPQFGGNKSNVSTCQDCHMRDVTGKGAAFFGNATDAPLRTDLPMHDLTGANTWVPQIIPQHPVFSATFTNEPARVAALNQGITRARTMLQNAASLTTQFDPDTHQLTVRVINNTGHKLPTGYPEGRRMWLQVQGYNSTGDPIYLSGAYNNATGELALAPDTHIYETKHGVTGTVASLIGESAGTSTFHFVLNNIILKDNRIPPRGFDYDAFRAVGAEPRTNGQPDPTLYANGQYWDEVTYTLPNDVVVGKVRLLYQTSSKEYIEFLRDENPNSGNPNNNGQILYNLWNNSTKSGPELMVEAGFGYDVYLPLVSRN